MSPPSTFSGHTLRLDSTGFPVFRRAMIWVYGFEETHKFVLSRHPLPMHDAAHGLVDHPLD
jgi:hypothetical protein